MTGHLTADTMGGPCAVTYRAAAAGGEDVEIRLQLAPADATLADAWARLTARYGTVDPRTIEIELREVAPAVRPLPILVQLYA